MALLYNRVSQKELKQQLLASDEKRITLSFYKYFQIPEPKQFRDELFIRLSELKVFGRIYIAHEGINAQVSVPENNFTAFENYIRNNLSDQHSEFRTKNQEPGTRITADTPNPELRPQNSEPENSNNMPLRLNIAVDDDGKSFWVLKIKVREKIVADGINDPDFNMNNKGSYVDAEAFNKLSEDENTIIVDIRNHYEYEVGHFENAIEIPSDTFREQLPMVVDMLKDKTNNNIIMYCTGGIRCEKASAYMLHKGFKNVYHLEGGIINYANTVKEKNIENKFLGKNFVFDDRLGEKIGNEIISNCHQCGKPADTHTNCVNAACHLLFIQCAECGEKYQGCCSVECFDFIQLPEEEQKILRKGIDKGRNVFNKARARKKKEDLKN
ncbi:MAG: rhodanese-related sulfurtransferase [Chitinophagales bacterium]